MSRWCNRQCFNDWGPRPESRRDPRVRTARCVCYTTGAGGLERPPTSLSPIHSPAGGLVARPSAAFHAPSCPGVRPRSRSYTKLMRRNPVPPGDPAELISEVQVVTDASPRPASPLRSACGRERGRLTDTLWGRRPVGFQRRTGRSNQQPGTRNPQQGSNPRSCSWLLTPDFRLAPGSWLLILVGDPGLAPGLCLFPKQVGRCLPMSPRARRRACGPKRQHTTPAKMREGWPAGRSASNGMREGWCRREDSNLHARGAPGPQPGVSAGFHHGGEAPTKIREGWCPVRELHPHRLDVSEASCCWKNRTW